MGVSSPPNSKGAVFFTQAVLHPPCVQSAPCPLPEKESDSMASCVEIKLHLAGAIPYFQLVNHGKNHGKLHIFSCFFFVNGKKTYGKLQQLRFSFSLFFRSASPVPPWS